MIVKTNTDSETKKVARNFARYFKNKGGVISLVGELGTGKTTFVQGFAEGLGIKDKVISPTFVLMRQHLINNAQILYHIDLYRLPDNPDIEGLGIIDLFKSPLDLVLIEWAEKIKNKLPKTAHFITITKLSDNTRQIEISDTIKE